MQEAELKITQNKGQEEAKSNFITINKQVFSHILIHFDGFSSLFNQLVNIKASVSESNQKEVHFIYFPAPAVRLDEELPPAKEAEDARTPVDL